MAEVGEPIGLEANWSSKLDLTGELVREGQIWSLIMYISEIREKIGLMEMGRN